MPDPVEYNSSYTGLQIDTAIGKVGTSALNTTASNLSDAVNELNTYAKVHTTTYTLPHSWSGQSSPYSQTLDLYTIAGYTATNKTKVDVQADASAFAQLLSDGVQALFVSNISSTLTIYAIGNPTTQDINIQLSYYETV